MNGFGAESKMEHDRRTAHWGMLSSWALATEARATIEAIVKVFILTAVWAWCGNGWGRS